MIDPLSRRLLKGAGLVPAGQGRGPVVLMYHSISRSSGSVWEVSGRSFTEQLKLLSAEGWQSVCVRDLLSARALPPRTCVLTFDDGFADNMEAFRQLEKFGMKATVFVVSGDIGGSSSWKDEGVPSRRMLDKEQLIEMNKAGMEIGSHTRTHARLTEAGRERLASEVAGSKKALEDVIGAPVVSFAYPYGLFSDESVQAVREAGYKLACTTRTGWFGSEKDLLRVRRVAVYNGDNLSTYARKLVFADNEVSWSRMTRYMASRFRARLGLAG